MIKRFDLELLPFGRDLTNLSSTPHLNLREYRRLKKEVSDIGNIPLYL
jgi:hypothetical protein